jgi:hypothetical protein
MLKIDEIVEIVSLCYLIMMRAFPYYYVMAGFLTPYFCCVCFFYGDCTVSTVTQVDQE